MLTLPLRGSFVEVTEQLGPPVAPGGEIELEVGGVRVRVRGQVAARVILVPGSRAAAGRGWPSICSAIWPVAL